MTENWASDQLTSAAQWFADEEVFFPAQTLIHTRESRLSIPVLRNLLDGRIDPETAATSIAAICKERIVEGGDVMSPEGVWKALCSAVGHFASSVELCDKLIALLTSLSKIDVLGSDGSPIRSSMNSDTFWRQLPGFSLAFRDEVMDIRTEIGNLQRDQGRFVECKRQFHGTNSFQARWLSRVGQDGPTREYGSALNIALWHLREALETKIEISPIGLQRVEIYVLGAAPWILMAGGNIFQLCKDNARNDGQKVVDPPFWDEGTDGYAYSGNDGFSLERWAFWKASLRQLAQLEAVHEVHEDVVEVAVRALATMEDLEKNI